jgi:Flp pilus assembly protein TadG
MERFGRGTDCKSVGPSPSAATNLRNRLKGSVPGDPCGQTLVEFALIIPVFLLLMLGVVQMVVIGGAALAVNQAAISCARYASLNPGAAQGSVDSYLTAVASPLINDSGLQPVVLSPISVPRATGSAVTVTVSYKLESKLFLGTTFFGVTFPSQLSVSETMTSE